MKRSLVALCLSAMISTLVGCAAEDATDEGATGVDAEELVRGAGISLRGADDADLKVTLKLADGAQAATANKRFIRVTVKRGAKEFGMWCTGEGAIGAAGDAQKISCGDYAETVSNDDDESFSMTFAKKDGAYEIESVDYFGDGTFYGERMAVLQPGWVWRGGAPDPLEHIALEVSRGQGSAADPFPMIADVGERLGSLLGQKVKNEVTRPLAVTSLTFQLTNEMEVDATLLLSSTGNIRVHPDKVSALATPGSLASGFAAPSTLKGRVLATLD